MATLYVSDVLEQIALTVEVQGWEQQFGPPETVCQRTLVWDGVGEIRPEEWLARVLFLAAEELTTPAESRVSAGAAMGGAHTISGISQESI